MIRPIKTMNMGAYIVVFGFSFHRRGDSIEFYNIESDFLVNGISPWGLYTLDSFERMFKTKVAE